MNDTAIASVRPKPPAPTGAKQTAIQPPSKVTPAIRPSAPGRRRGDNRSIAFAFVLVVCAPTLLAALYFGLIASPQYISESNVTIRSSKSQASSILSDLVAPTDGFGGSTETQLVANYLNSRDLLGRIEKDVGFRDRYATYQADYFSRLQPGAGNEDTHSYFEDVLQVTDDGSGLLTISVRGFTADDAVAVAISAIGAAEEMVNRLSNTAEADAMKSAEAEIKRSEQRLLEAADALTAYQKRSGNINPGRSAESLLAIIAGLESERSATRVRIAELRSYLKPNSPQVNALQSKLAAMNVEIARERKRLAAQSGSALVDELRTFESERLQLEIAETGYKSALGSLEAARLKALNDRSYLVAFIPPSIPDVAVKPKRMYKILSAFVVSLLAFGVGALIVGAVREHARA